MVVILFKRVEAILAVRVEAGGPSDIGEDKGTNRGKKAQPYLTFLLDEGGKWDLTIDN